MQKILPFLQWLPYYKKEYLVKDLVAGLTVGIVLIPQSMAYAMIAGLPPVYGLYASLIPVLVYAFLGTSRQLAVGPVAMDSLLVAAGLAAFAINGGEYYVAMAVFLAFLVGAIQMVLGFLRMGFLVNFLSRPVISGFTSAAAVIIIFSQLKHILGTPVERSHWIHELIANIVVALPQTNVVDLLLGLGGIVLIIFIRKWNKNIPTVLLVVVLGILTVYLFDLQSFGTHIVGAVPEGLPHFEIPRITLKNTAEIWPMALTLALVGYLEAISIGKAMEEKRGIETIDPNKELIALGSSNMIGSFFQSYPITGSFSRSAISDSAGTKSPIASLFSVALVVITLLFLTPLFYYLPKAVLASIIMVSVFGLIDVAYPKVLWKYRKDEFTILSITFLVTLFIGIPQGILVGVLLSLLLMVYKSSKPHFAVLGKIKDSEYYKNVDRFGEEIEFRDDLLIVRFDSQLYFGNKSYFKKQLFHFIDSKKDTLKAVILNAEAINYIDSTATAMLVKTIREIHDRNLKFYISGAIGPTRDIIFSSGIIKEIPKERLFITVRDAVKSFDNPSTATALQERIAYQNRPKQ